MTKKNRNTKEELETNIEYIDIIIDYINRGDARSAKQILNDWKIDLLWELRRVEKIK